MATGGDVLTMLCPNVEWTIYGDDFESIQWKTKTAPITKAQFEQGFEDYDAWKNQQQANKLSSKQAILDKIGLTAEEAQILLS